MNEKDKNRIALRLATYFLCKNGAFASECYTGGYDVGIAEKMGVSIEEMKGFASILRQDIRETGKCFWHKDRCEISRNHEF